MRNRERLVVAGLVVGAIALIGATSAGASPDDFTGVEYVLPTYSEAVNLEFGPDGRVFIARQNGLIMTASSVDASTASILWDGRAETHDLWDRGLLGMELHPDFPEQPYLYVLYTHGTGLPPLEQVWPDDCPTPPGSTGDGCVVSAKLVRLRVNQSGTSVLAETVLIHDWCQQFPSHSIGDLEFGPDAALYVSGGDGADFNRVDHGQFGGSPGSQTPRNPCGDPVMEGGALRSQDLRTPGDPVGPHGAVLRINPLYDPSDPNSRLALPDNPRIGDSDPTGKLIVAYGLRNPFRMTFRPGTQELYIADVGWGLWEELNLHPDPRSSVRNFGWPCYEGGVTGSVRQGGYDGFDIPICESLYSTPAAVAAPLYAYHHNYALTDTNGPALPNPADGCPPAAPPAPVTSSITGLVFYEGGSYPGEYVGALFGGDYSRNCIWVMYPGPNGRPDPSTIEIFHQESGLGPVDLEVGPDGNLYFVNRNNGRIGRFRWAGVNAPPVAVLSADVTSGDAPLEVTFDATGSHDPNGHPIEYEWDLDGDGVFETGEAIMTRTFGPGSHTVRLRVRDFPGLLSTVRTIVINASNHSPDVQITSPNEATSWAVGDLISFGALATDPEEGTLAADRFQWDLVLHHCTTSDPDTCHDHHLQSWSGVAGGSFSAPDHGYPSHLELRVTVSDMYGQTGSASVEIQPKTVRVRIESEPGGVEIGVGPDAASTPRETTVIAGSSVSLSAPPIHSAGGNTWVFSHWSNGGSITQEVTAPSTDITLKAFYELDDPSEPVVGDGIALVDMSTARWTLIDPQTGHVSSFVFGRPGDHPILGDWDCDGIQTPGAYRRSNGMVYLRNSLSGGNAHRVFKLGRPDDFPLAGDFDGDHCDTVSVYRPSERRIFVVNEMGESGKPLYASHSYYFGAANDRPFVGDFDGNGTDEVAMHRESKGTVYIRYSLTSGAADATFVFGRAGDRVLAGLWDPNASATDTVGVYRPSTGILYLRHRNTAGPADISIPFGGSSVWPVAGRFER